MWLFKKGQSSNWVQNKGFRELKHIYNEFKYKLTSLQRVKKTLISIVTRK
jgi:hypothetical protein